MNKHIAVSVLGIVVVALVAYQFAFRYQYMHLVGMRVLRIDHLTGKSCEPSSSPFSVANPCDPPSEEQKLAYATSLARTAASTSGIDLNGPNYQWQAEDALMAALTANPGGDEENATPNPNVAHLLEGNKFDETYLVCLCNADRVGWRWEVHIPTRQAFYVNDDDVLARRYGVKRN